MSGVGNSLSIPNFIKAGSPLGLHRLMLMNNLKSGNRYKYQDIQFVNGFWYAWFYEDKSFREVGSEIAKEIVKNK